MNSKSVWFSSIFFAAILIVFPSVGRGQQVTPSPNSTASNAQVIGSAQDARPVTRTVTADYDYLSSKEWWLTVAALIFFLIIIFLKFLLVRNDARSSRKDLIHFELTVIIAATVITIIAGFDEKQIAPALGLFGTIAGYLLASSRRTSNPPHEEERKQ